MIGVHLVREWRVRDGIYSLTQINDKNFIATGAEGIAFHIEHSKPTHSISLFYQTPTTLYSSFLDGDQLVLGGRSGLLHIVDINSRESRAVIQLQGDIFSLEPLARNRFVAGQGRGFIDVVQLNAGSAEVVASGRPSPMNIRSLCALDETEFLAGVSNGTLRQQRIEGAQIIEVGALPANEKSVFTVLKADSLLLTGGRDARIRLWDISQGEEIRPLEIIDAHMGTVNKIIQLDGAGLPGYLASASRDKTIKLWRREGQGIRLIKVIDRPKHPEAHIHSVNALLALPGGKLVSAGDDRSIKMWQLDVEAQ